MYYKLFLMPKHNKKYRGNFKLYRFFVYEMFLSQVKQFSIDTSQAFR